MSNTLNKKSAGKINVRKIRDSSEVDFGKALATVPENIKKYFSNF